MDNIICSIIIATRNEEKYLEKCLKTLESQTIDRSSYEIIVVDGMSQDNTLNIARQFKSKHTNTVLLHNPKKIASAGFNIGIKNSRGCYVFIVGAHAQYPDDFIEKSIHSIITNKVDCVGGREIAVGQSTIGKVFATVRNTPFGGGLSPYRYSSQKQLVRTVAFGCYTREILEKVGGFDEQLVKNQDNHLNKRIISAGGKILFDPDISFYYYTRNSIRQMASQLFGYGFWEAKLIKKERDQLSIATLVPTLFVIYTIIALAFFIIRGSPLPLLLEMVPYLCLFSYFAVKKVIPQRQNILAALMLYLIIHFSIGIGFVFGLLDKTER